MKKIAALLLLCLSAHVNAESIATLPNQADGKIVLTNEVCKDPDNGTVYEIVKRSYNYSASGGTSEGCWIIEDETIVIIWFLSTGRTKSRYPVANFTLSKPLKNKNKNTY